MERTQKLSSAIGFAMKAGKVKSGDFIVEKLVRAGKARLVLIDETAAENTRKKYEKLCESTGTLCLAVDGLGHCIGKPGRMLAAVDDENFCKMIRNAYAERVSQDSNDGGNGAWPKQV